MRRDIGIGEYAVSADQDDVLKTYALGSCVAVMAWDRVNKISGMIHVALPESKINPEKAAIKPGYFADTGVPLMLSDMRKRGSDLRKLVIKLAGGSSIMDANRKFDIGKRNVIAIKRYLWKNGLGVVKEDVGGSISRTVSMNVKTGEVILSNAQRTWNL